MCSFCKIPHLDASLWNTAVLPMPVGNYYIYFINEYEKEKETIRIPYGRYMAAIDNVEVHVMDCPEAR